MNTSTIELLMNLGVPYENSKSSIDHNNKNQILATVFIFDTIYDSKSENNVYIKYIKYV